MLTARVDRTAAAAGAMRLAVAAVGISFASASPAAGQPPALTNWTGSIRCELQADAQGYSHRETQTWTLTGAAPTLQGSITVYPATWSVTAQGWHDRARNTSRRVAEWTASIPGRNAPVSAPIGFTLHPVGGRFDVAKWHAQLTSGGGYTGPDQFINDGVAQPAGRLVQTVYEWQFPKIEAATTDTQLVGSQTSEVRAFLGPLQPAEAQATVACSWALGRGAAPVMPPPAMAPAQPRTAEGTVSGGTTPAPGATAAAPPTQTSVPGATPGANQPAASAAGGSTIAIPRGTSNATVPGPVAAGGAAAPATGGNPAATSNPSSFSARQTADGTVVLTWSPVAGAGSYMVGGPGTNVGVTVAGTSHTITGLPAGAHTWTIATVYDPGGVLTTADTWPRTTTTVVNASGRYRITLTGFRVQRPTFDDRVNGNGDEVYASAAVTTIDRRNDAVLQQRTIVRSATYGDTSRDARRVRAGSFSASGGLWTADVAPAGTDPRLVSGNPSGTHLPLALWEGTLRDGIDAVVINPVLWEEDGQLEYYNEWADANSQTRRQAARAAAQAAAIKDRAGRGDLAPFRGMLVFICSSASDLIPDCKPGNDRPIGINREVCVGDTFASNLPAWCDLTLVMTREGIEKNLSGPATGGAAGVISVPLVEPAGVDLVKGGLDGSYELYVRVERLP